MDLARGFRRSRDSGKPLFPRGTQRLQSSNSNFSRSNTANQEALQFENQVETIVVLMDRVQEERGLGKSPSIAFVHGSPSVLWRCDERRLGQRCL